ncbi:hypothetical protein CYMTET_35961 [Cymbomonas tetramitiformis]|uniref:Uncharacterized protein n=1 Tax=Cymbomonas tetramitiformis TaxID=36881 RepID=A0AAE0KN31_9CHLO|nr:hypothetical protein CYMTET_35961 [Cymbomonas tetramitiformis]
MIGMAWRLLHVLKPGLKQKVLLVTLLFAAHTVSSQPQSQRLPGMRAEAEERMQIATARIDALTKLSNGATSAEESRERLRQHKENLHTDLKSRITCNGIVCTLGDSKPAGAGSYLRGAAGLPADVHAVAEPLKEIAAPLVPEVPQTDTPATEQEEEPTPGSSDAVLAEGAEAEGAEAEGAEAEGAEAEGPKSTDPISSEEGTAAAAAATLEGGSSELELELVPEKKDETATEVLEAISEDNKMVAEDEPATAEEESKVVSDAADEETADMTATLRDDSMEAGSATIQEPEKMQLPGDHNKMDLVMGAAGVAMVAGVLLIVSRFFKSSEKVEATAGGPSAGPEGGSAAAGVSKRAAVRRGPPAPRPPRTTRPMPAV